MEVRIKILNPEAKIPVYGREGDAGLDLYSCEDFILEPKERHVFKLGFALELPGGTAALVWDRSGMAVKHGIHSLAGVIDCNYRGEVSITLYNTSDEAWQCKKGDRIAQMIIQRFEKVDLKKVDELSETERGENAYLSSGR